MKDFDQTISFLKRVVGKDDRDADAISQFLYLAPVFMYLKDYTGEQLAGRYVFVSREWERTYNGIKREQIIGQTDYDFMERAEADRLRKIENHALEIGRTVTVSDGAGTRYSGWKPIKMALIPIKISGDDTHSYVAAMALPSAAGAFL